MPRSRLLCFEDSTLIDTTVHVTGLQNGKSHYWKVRAINARGASTFSSAWTFTTVEGMPLTPSLRAPVASTASVPIDPVLQWKSSQWATRYHLQVAEDTPFKILVLEDTAATDTIYRLPALQNDKRYYWRVRALNRIGTSPFSEIWNFMTIVAPPGRAGLTESLKRRLQRFAQRADHLVQIHARRLVSSAGIG